MAAPVRIAARSRNPRRAQRRPAHERRLSRVALRGHLPVTDASGTTIAKDDYSAAPLLGLTLSHRY